MKFIKIKKYKKGFTLVELLAVIVVLSIIILIASSGIGSALQKARKSALAIEGNELINAAKSAYQLDILDNKVKSGSACYSLEYLFQEGYYSKGGSDKDGGYTGSVLVTSDGNKVSYKFWIGNGSFVFASADTGTTGTAASTDTSGNGADHFCGLKGQQTGPIIFAWNGSKGVGVSPKDVTDNLK